MRRFPTRLVIGLLPCILCGPAAAATTLKGAAILDNPCGKVAVKQMGLLHAGKFDEANKLSTKEMQAQWAAMPAKDREMMSAMSKEMSSMARNVARRVGNSTRRLRTRSRGEVIAAVD